jgi:protoporphyrin/coproporphyrin ferrochelatase
VSDESTPQTIGVLLMAYGGPNNLDEVGPYLADIRGGRPTSPELLEEITDRYRQIGGSSPILALTTAQATGVEQALNDAAAADAGVRYRTYVGMRHWHPYIDEVVPDMLADGVTRIIGVVMAPHYSRMSVGAYMGKLDKALTEQGADIPVDKVESWKDEPPFINAVSARVREALTLFPDDERADVPLLFTAHSLPSRILESGDPYPEELQTSVRLVVEQLQPKHWRWAFQSQGASAEPWLGPTVEDTLAQLHEEGFKNVLLVPIGFVCDHVEVLYDVDIEHKHQAAELGIRLERPRMLNDDPGLIDAVANAVRRVALTPAGAV